MTQTRLLLIRHAESSWNANGRWQGHGDPPLSDRGRGQAEALAALLADEHVDALVSSDLLRARTTAEALERQWGLSAELDGQFRELDVGRWTGCTRAQIVDRDADLLDRFEAEDPHVRPGGGESRAEIRRRARIALGSWIEKHPDETLAVVTHLGVVRAVLPGREPENAECIRVTSAEVTLEPDA